MGVCKNNLYYRTDLISLLHQPFLLLQLTPHLFFLVVLFRWLSEVWASDSLSMCLFHMSNGLTHFNLQILICRVLKAILK